MPIIVDCDCGKKLRARDDLAGRWVDCPACGRGLLVPLPENQAGSESEVALKSEPAPEAPEPPPVYPPSWRPPNFAPTQRPQTVISAPATALKNAEASWRGFMHYLLLAALIPL